MDSVNIINVRRGGSGWHVNVEVGDDGEAITYNVAVDDDYYEELVGGTVGVETLVEEAFNFLLEHEPKESIMRDFDLDVIGTYFPDFEVAIKDRLNR